MHHRTQGTTAVKFYIDERESLGYPHWYWPGRWYDSVSAYVSIALFDPWKAAKLSSTITAPRNDAPPTSWVVATDVHKEVIKPAPLPQTSHQHIWLLSNCTVAAVGAGPGKSLPPTQRKAAVKSCHYAAQTADARQSHFSHSREEHATIQNSCHTLEFNLHASSGTHALATLHKDSVSLATNSGETSALRDPTVLPHVKSEVSLQNGLQHSSTSFLLLKQWRHKMSVQLCFQHCFS